MVVSRCMACIQCMVLKDVGRAVHGMHGVEGCRQSSA